MVAFAAVRHPIYPRHSVFLAQVEETLMCIPGDYWHKRGVDKPCGTFTVEEVQEAYKAKYANHIQDGTWTREQFIEWFPRDRAKMTLDEVRAFADASTSP